MTDPIIPGDLLTRAKAISGLRQLADYLDAHPDVPVAPFGWDPKHLPRPARGRRRAAGRGRQGPAVLGVPVTDDTARGGHYTADRMPASRPASLLSWWSSTG